MEDTVRYKTLKSYIYAVADYLDMEYDGLNQDKDLSDDEKYTIKLMVTSHYELKDSVSNAANYIIDYVRKNRDWKQDNLK